MSFSHGIKNINLEDILNKVSEADIAFHYLNIREIPCVIHSPLRVDKRPSFGLYSTDGIKVKYRDLSTEERGGIFDLLGNLWNCDYAEVLIKIYNDIDLIIKGSTIKAKKSNRISSTKSYQEKTDLKCKIRDWEDYDIEYWRSYGIELKWLKYAEVYPISYKIVIKNGNIYNFKADKYAYAYVEHKEGKVTLKIYQPFNKDGYKWSNKHDSSVVSLWTKVPNNGECICICSSLKDALCLWSNTGIPAIAIQGEGYNLSDTAINELKNRFKKQFICLDNDAPGLKDAENLAIKTKFINIVLPQFSGGKDISDLFKIKGKEKFIEIFKSLFNVNKKN